MKQNNDAFLTPEKTSSQSNWINPNTSSRAVQDVIEKTQIKIQDAFSLNEKVKATIKPSK